MNLQILGTSPLSPPEDHRQRGDPGPPFWAQQLQGPECCVFYMQVTPVLTCLHWPRASPNGLAAVAKAGGSSEVSHGTGSSREAPLDSCHKLRCIHCGATGPSTRPPYRAE